MTEPAATSSELRMVLEKTRVSSTV